MLYFCQNAIRFDHIMMAKLENGNFGTSLKRGTDNGIFVRLLWVCDVYADNTTFMINDDTGITVNTVLTLITAGVETAGKQGSSEKGTAKTLSHKIHLAFSC